MNVPLVTTPTTKGAPTSVSPKSGSSIRKSAYGLGFRFSVNIDAMPLGRWQSCGGLKVSFKNTEIKRGGDYTSVVWLPDRIAYGNIVLKRAADAASSAKVQAWLATSARAWMEGEASSGSDVTITLLDYKRKPVLTWTLQDARPAAWSVSDLDAMSSKLAIETLELAHKGFEVNVGGPAGRPSPAPKAPAPGGTANATGPKLPMLYTDNIKQVIFQYPPEKVTIIRNTDDRSSNQVVQLAQGEATALQNKPGVSSYKMENLVIEGEMETQKYVNLLLEWATELKSTDAKQTAKPADDPGKTGGKKKLPKITFEWGEGFAEQVQLTQLTAGYTRFSATGKPLRANVTITLDIVAKKGPPSRPKTSAPAKPVSNGAGNPTSGGIPGRASHVLLATDSLPLVAREHYGTPGAWRDIARANDIDDPMRVAPGSQLYLPAFSELTEIGERR